MLLFEPNLFVYPSQRKLRKNAEFSLFFLGFLWFFQYQEQVFTINNNERKSFIFCCGFYGGGFVLVSHLADLAHLVLRASRQNDP